MSQPTTAGKPKRARREGGSTSREGRLHSGRLAVKNDTECRWCEQKHVLKSGEPSCTGHKIGKREPCSSRPMKGGLVCRMHGGKAPQVMAKAETRLLYAAVEGQVAELMRECDMPDQHPIDGLLEVVRHTGSMMRLLGSLVAALDVAPTVERDPESETGVALIKPGLYGPNHMGDGTPHVLMVMYGQWQDRFARACKLALDANIDERLVRNAEATTGVLFKVIDEALKAADLEPEQAARFGKTLADGLRKHMDPFGIQDKTTQDARVG